MEVQQAFSLMREGYCLWVGAGATIHLASAAGIHVPLWGALVESLEQAAGAIPLYSLGYYQRLETCLEKLRWEDFQRQLHDHILVPTCKSVVRLAHRTSEQGSWVPQVAREFAKLGQLANPIVSFNIESITSRLLSYADSSVQISAFSPRVPGAVQDVVAHHYSLPNCRRFRRMVYHPHGSLDLGGICVMTEQGHRALDGTLAFQLAVHAAFGTNLVIVGMSLEEPYLRDQLAEFRPYINNIIWMVAEPPREQIFNWIAECGVNMVLVSSWRNFWNEVGARLPSPPELHLDLTWCNVFQMAYDIVAGRSMLDVARFFRGSERMKDHHPALDHFYEHQLALAAARGEPAPSINTAPTVLEGNLSLIGGAMMKALNDHGAFDVPATSERQGSSS